MGADGKIMELDDLARLLVPLRARKKIVHCHGVFDLLHVGHIRHFEQAKRKGDVLVVTVTPDPHVNKGPHRPFFSEHLRAEAIAALACVDYVAINKWPNAVETIKLLRPAFYVKGSDYKDAQLDRTGGIELEEEAVQSVGGRLVFTEDITFSSTHLINQFLPVFPKEVGGFLSGFAGRHRQEDVLRTIDGCQGMKALVIGEAIIDEYQYCQTLGKSGKEPILAARYVSSERFAGGILAVANHAASFSSHVGMLTFLGSADTQEEFIRARLSPGVQPDFLYLDGAPTILKKRFVELYPFQKLFEVYVMGDAEGDPSLSRALCEHLDRLLPAYDVVIVTDYGHGMLGPEAVGLLCDKAKFLAVNTQVNADNRGFNTISKYRRADYVCVSENELRLEARNRRRELKDLVADAASRLSCPRILVTRGRQGCLCYDGAEGFFEIPAFTSKIVDRVGAGDAVFAVTSLCVAQNTPMEVVGFIGNAVGAQAVAIVGHQQSIDRAALCKHMESLLK